MVVPLLAWGLIAGAGAVATYFIADAGSNDSEQNSKTEQTSKNETKQSSELASKITTNTTNESNQVFNFQGANISSSSLGFSSDTSPKVDSKSTPTQTQGTTTSPAFTSTPTQTATQTQQKTSSGLSSLFDNPLLLAGVGVGGYLWFTADDKKKGGSKK